ncbi:MAG TPA: adenosylhomocysteinase [Chloroflexota bacterium]|nr:adenosylhomocysteinase [Chloroflexota bacterium]
MQTDISARGDVRDRSLAAKGKIRIEWADASMPVLRMIRERFLDERPLEGVRIAACLHVTSETANLARTLQAAGALLTLCASNPLSTQDDVAAALNEVYGIPTFAIKAEDRETYYRHIDAALDSAPNVTMDDGNDLVTRIHQDRRDLLAEIFGGTEETTTGVIRLRSMQAEGALAYPVIAVNEADTKHLFDNRYGTGQSTVDGLLRATNMLLAGKRAVVAGYGWCGRGLARRLSGLGANVIVTEIDPTRAIEAVMDGYLVMPMEEAARVADVIITVTGNCNVLDQRHFAVMKDGVVIANTGHFNDEINIPALERMSQSRRELRDFVEEFTVDGRRINLLAEGRLLNLAAAEGHPAAVMDMSFANQALSVEYLRDHRGDLTPDVYVVPQDIDREIARLKLASMGIAIDRLTPEQEAYLASWQSGT